MRQGSVCVAMPAISTMEEGYKVYMVADACGDVSDQPFEYPLPLLIKSVAISLKLF